MYTSMCIRLDLERYQEYVIKSVGSQISVVVSNDKDLIRDNLAMLIVHPVLIM